MEDEQELKQQFLRKEILEQNYDPQSFIDFLTLKKGETAADINNWTLDELKLIVVEYKNSKDKTLSPKKDILSEQPENKTNKNEKRNNYISYYNEDTNNE